MQKNWYNVCKLVDMMHVLCTFIHLATIYGGIKY